MRKNDFDYLVKKHKMQYFNVPYRLNWCSAYLDCAHQNVITSAIDKYLHFYYWPEKKPQIIIESREQQETYVVSMREHQPRKQNWKDYIDGCLAVLAQNNLNLQFGAHIIVENDLPSGVGLSSSACFIIGILKCLCEINKIKYNNNLLVSLGYQVEHNFLNIPCGLMDFKAILHPYGVWDIKTTSIDLNEDRLLYNQPLFIVLLEDNTQQHIHLNCLPFKEIASNIDFIAAHALELATCKIKLPIYSYLVEQTGWIYRFYNLFEETKNKKFDYIMCDWLLQRSNQALNTLLQTSRFKDLVGVQMLGSGLRGYGFAVLDPKRVYNFGHYKAKYCHTMTHNVTDICNF